MAKKKIAMFLGAGASKAFQYPLTKEILNLIIESINSADLFSQTGIPKQRGSLYRLMLKELLISLSPGLAAVFNKTQQADADDLPLITDLLSQAEHFANNSEALVDWNYEIEHTLLGHPKGMNERWELKDVIALLDWAIIYVINQQGKYTKEKLSSFMTWVRRTNQSANSFVSIITTNFDFAVEWNVLTETERNNAHKVVDYGFNWRDVYGGEIYLRPSDPKFRFLKLHGSIDWLKCERCGFIYINPLVDIYDLAFLAEKSDATECHCGYWPLKPVLVTPSFSRSVRDTNLSQIWRNTLEEFRLADEWVIAGYSLPGEDLNIKSLFLRALQGRENPPAIKVIQLNCKSRPRFDYFFGKDNYEFIEGGFENYDFNKILAVKAK